MTSNKSYDIQDGGSKDSIVALGKTSTNRLLGGFF